MTTYTLEEVAALLRRDNAARGADRYGDAIAQLARVAATDLWIETGKVA